MKENSTMQTINVQPSARILRILGDIEFSPWQCLAELIDNAFDDFLELRRNQTPWPDGFEVSVTVPKRSTPVDEAVVIVADNGRGMDMETLNRAVRAGWSSNDRFSKLGLFGMGFNISTARLGKRARVLTTRPGDVEWVGVEIDLDVIGDDFEVPVITRPKSSHGEHGTLVEVDRLHPERAGWLSSNVSRVRSTLGNIYSHLLSSEPFRLIVNGTKVQPRLPCVWDKSRSVTYGQGSTAEQIPAIIEFEKTLPVAYACSDCGNWQSPGHEKCKACGSENIILRERKIRGWLGIQRYLHKTEFGVDFLRNGRKILIQDKGIFEWSDPNDPLSSPESEYPIELGQGGRIVGEVHLDHVPVNYQKSAFEWSDRAWISALNFLRGEGPLLPVKARQLGYLPNESPLGRLHKAYRRNDPGYRCLVPGDGTGPIHLTTREWAEKFHKGEAEYQADNKWWDAVVAHEAKNAPQPPPPGPAPPGPVGGLPGVDEDDQLTPKPHPNPTPPVETERERIERLRSGAQVIPDLSKDYGLKEFGNSINVQALLVGQHDVKDREGNRTPVLLVQDRGTNFFALVDENHPVFRDFADDPAHYLVIEVAHHLRTRANHIMPISQAAALLKEREFPDRKLDPGLLASEARDILGMVREKMAKAISEDPERAWQFLTSDERAVTEGNLAMETTDLTLEDVLGSGEFLLYVPAMFLARLVEEWPEAFMDSEVFRDPYAGLEAGTGRRVKVGKIVSYLYDVALIAEGKMKDEVQLARCRLSLQLVRRELAWNEGQED